MILSGRTLEQINLALMTGVNVAEVRVIPDVEETLLIL